MSIRRIHRFAAFRFLFAGLVFFPERERQAAEATHRERGVMKRGAVFAGPAVLVFAETGQHVQLAVAARDGFLAERVDQERAGLSDECAGSNEPL